MARPPMFPPFRFEQEWEEQGVGGSYSIDMSEDSFDEESICSWLTEPESLCNVWRGWTKQTSVTGSNKVSDIDSLIELAAKAVAKYIPFEVVETYEQPVPEDIQLRIAFWSFPDDEEDIRLYSCLANGSGDEFTKGEALCKQKAVRDPLQIGFHLSATVVAPNHLKQHDVFKVSVVFDRRKISSCDCSCKQTWCQHVVALCLHRIYLANSVCLRAPVSETLSRLTREQLQKFSQYLINDLPRQVLPTAQKLLDDLLQNSNSEINATKGAPDPTAGALAHVHPVWCLEDSRLRNNIKKTLVKFCVPSPVVVLSDINCMTTNAPPAITEFQNLLRPLRGREPEGIWNLLSIVRELFRRQDSNSIHLLKLLTDEMLQCEQLLVWWFQTKNSAAYVAHGPVRGAFSGSAQNAASCLCDEIVSLWRLVMLNPALQSIERDDLLMQLRDWHTGAVEGVRRAKCAGGGAAAPLKKAEIECFPGFKPALEASQLRWNSDGDGAEGGLGISSTSRPPLSAGGLLVATHFFEHEVCKASPVTSHQVDKSLYSFAPQQGGGPFRNPAQGLLADGSTRRAEGAAVAAGGSGSSNSDLAAEAEGRSLSSSSEGFCEKDEDGSLKEWPGRVDRSSADAPVMSGKPDAAVVGAANSSQAAAAKKILTSRTNSQDGSQSSSAENPASVALPGEAACSSEKPKTQQPSGGAGSGASKEKQCGDGDGVGAAEDPYKIYYFDPTKEFPGRETRARSEPDYFSGLDRVMEEEEILLSRAEALHVHGYTSEACTMASKLAEELLNDTSAKDCKSRNSGCKEEGQYTQSFQTTTLARASFLCQVLLERKQYHHLAFRVGLVGLEASRLPAANKALEVKLANQEVELVALLKRVPLGHHELGIIMERALSFRSACLSSTGEEALLPLAMATFFFESLCLPVSSVSASSSQSSSRYAVPVHQISMSAENREVGFEAAVAAIGLRTSIAEYDHPILCESLRRQRGELAVAMLLHYKDNQEKLDMILEKFLDKEIHSTFKVASLTTYMSNNKGPASRHAVPSISTASSSSSAALPSRPAVSDSPNLRHLTGAVTMGGAIAGGARRQSGTPPQSRQPPSHGLKRSGDSGNSLGAGDACSEVGSAAGSSPHAGSASPGVAGSSGDGDRGRVTPGRLSRPGSTAPAGVERGKEAEGTAATAGTVTLSVGNRNDSSGALGGTPSAAAVSGRANAGSCPIPMSAKDEEALEAKLRCGIYRINKKPSAGMAAVDSSAPETTSSDNSPTVSRRAFPKVTLGPASDSGSSGKGSDTSNDGERKISPSAGFVRGLVPNSGMEPVVRPREAEGSSVKYVPQYPVLGADKPMFPKVYRSKGKSRLQPTRPNQPSEALSHYMFELAKSILSKAGGSSATSTFTPRPPPPRGVADGGMGGAAAGAHVSLGPHRALHMCAFQIGLYALGVHNCINPNWLSRTYSSHVSWITGQAIEIGSPAINMLIDTWEGHLTPPEMASLADRSARGRDPGVVAAAAELALSCLPHAHALSPSEIQRALLQCKDQGRPLLERACLAVESAAKDGGVYPEVLFDVARKWDEMHEATARHHAAAGQALREQVASPSHCQYQQAPVSAAQPVVASPHHMNAMQVRPHMGAPGDMAPMSLPSYQQYAQAAMAAGGNVGPFVGQMGRPGTLPPHTVAPPQITYGAFVPCVAPFHPAGSAQSMPAAYVTTYSYSNSLYQPLVPTPMNIQNAYHQPHQQALGFQHAPLPAHTMGGPLPSGVPHPAVMAGGVMVGAVPPGVPMHLPPGGLGEGEGMQGAAAGGQGVGEAHTTYLHAAYRVGMLAMDTLGKRVHDDRPVTKYARSPPYKDNVKWLLSISMKLGHLFVQRFCHSAVNSLVSPFLLQEIASEAALYLARYNHSQVQNVIRSPYLNFVMQRCVQMFVQCAHTRIHHISVSDHDDFISMIVSARSAFFMVPGGPTQFQDMLQGLRRNKCCKKDLWQKIMSSLSSSVMQ